MSLQVVVSATLNAWNPTRGVGCVAVCVTQSWLCGLATLRVVDRKVVVGRELRRVVA